MATTRKTATRKKATTPAEPPVTKTKVQKKKFEKTDGIMCKSIAAGKTFVAGPRSKRTYEFQAENVEREIEYQDLESMANGHSSYLFKPFIIVEDDDFVAMFPKLQELYDSMYSATDLSLILSQPAKEVERILPKLPSGAKDAVKNIAAGMIADGSLNDLRVIKALDKEFGTQLVDAAGLYD